MESKSLTLSSSPSLYLDFQSIINNYPKGGQNRNYNQLELNACTHIWKAYKSVNEIKFPTKGVCFLEGLLQLLVQQLQVAEADETGKVLHITDVYFAL